MSRQMRASDVEVFRVKVTQVFTQAGREPRTVVDHLGPYSTFPAAAGQATAARRRYDWPDVSVTTQVQGATLTWRNMKEPKTGG